MTDLLPAAYTRIDEVNSRDPNRWQGLPLALHQGRLATTWVARLTAASARSGRPPSTPLLLAARAHHLERWILARGDYPDGRAGYLRWRRDNKAHQAAAVAPLLAEVGYGQDVIDRVGELLLRNALGTDQDTQTLEDAACLVFFETQFDGLAARVDEEQLARAVAKTAGKMSGNARQLADGLVAGTYHDTGWGTPAGRSRGGQP